MVVFRREGQFIPADNRDGLGNRKSYAPSHVQQEEGICHDSQSQLNSVDDC
jgi:hypothetical protein